jgi:hypothetical protein
MVVSLIPEVNAMELMSTAPPDSSYKDVPTRNSNESF